MSEEVDNILLRQKRWLELRLKLKTQFGRMPDMNGVLLLVGIQELGKAKAKFTKEEKQDLMHIATCRLLSEKGYYEFLGRDEDGWPHWELIEPISPLVLKEQENLLKDLLLNYFNELGYFSDKESVV
jgi:hypothetical protein